jgi:hypothetical protein
VASTLLDLPSEIVHTCTDIRVRALVQTAGGRINRNEQHGPHHRHAAVLQREHDLRPRDASQAQS